MIDINIAKKIGYKQAFKAVSIGLAIAYLIMGLTAGPLWPFDFEYTPTLIFAAVVLYGMAYLFGRLAGKLIIIDKYPSVLIGIVTGILMVVFATFIGSLIGFFNEGLPNKSPISDPFWDYILKPVLLVLFWGLIPMVVVGVWYGLSIKSRGRKINSA